MDSSRLKSLLVEDPEFHELRARHQELESRLGEIQAKSYRHFQEEVESRILKKTKLMLKDRMQAIAQDHGTAETGGRDAAPGPRP